MPNISARRRTFKVYISHHVFGMITKVHYKYVFITTKFPLYFVFQLLIILLEFMLITDNILKLIKRSKTVVQTSIR